MLVLHRQATVRHDEHHPSASPAEQIRAVVDSDSWNWLERVEDTGSEGRRHQVWYISGVNPRDLSCLARLRCRLGERPTPESDGDDPISDILVQTAEAFYDDSRAGLLGNFTADSLLERFMQFQDTTRRLPMAVVASPYSKDAIIRIDHDSDHADGVFGKCGEGVSAVSEGLPCIHGQCQGTPGATGTRAHPGRAR